MTYFMRAVRYALRLVAILAVLFVILYLTGTLNTGGGTLFHALIFSWRGALLIGVLVVLAVIYPNMAFGVFDVKADPVRDREQIVNAFLSCGFSLREENDGVMIFRADGVGKKLLMQFDDRITVTPTARGIEIEGMKKEVSRVVTRLGAMLFL